MNNELLQNADKVSRAHVSKFGCLIVESYGLIVIKPQEIPEGVPEIEDVVCEMILDRNLYVAARKEKVLSNDDVRKMYTDIFRDEPETDRDLLYRADLMSYMTSGRSTALCVRGDNARAKTYSIKSELRSSLSYDFVSEHLKNFIHVPEPEEMGRSMMVFWEKMSHGSRIR